MSDDTLAWIDRGEKRVRLLLWHPGDSDATTMREWPSDEDTRYQIDPSPDNARFLLSVAREVACDHEEHAHVINEVEFTTPTHWELVENAVYDLDTESWIDLPTDSTRRASWWSDSWAGPRTLAWSGDDYLALESIDKPGEMIYVVD